MTRTLRLALAAGALLALLIGASPVAAAGDGAAYGAAYGAHVAHHATEMGGFSGVHNPGVMHRGFSGWTESCAH